MSCQPHRVTSGQPVNTRTGEILKWTNKSWTNESLSNKGSKLYCTPVSQVTAWCNGVITPDSQSRDTEFRSWWNLLCVFCLFFFFVLFLLLLLQHQQHQKCAAFFFFPAYMSVCQHQHNQKQFRASIPVQICRLKTNCWFECLFYRYFLLLIVTCALFVYLFFVCLFVVINFFFYLFSPLHFYKYMCTPLRMRVSPLWSEVRARVYVLQVPDPHHVPHHGGAEGREPPAAEGGQGWNADAA